MARSSLPDRLKMLREMASLSGRELDRLSGLGEGHTRMIETGKRPRVEADTAQALAVTLGVSLDFLIAGKGERPTEQQVRAAVQMARSRAA